MFEYYDRRANEYDHRYMGTGLFADRQRPEWHDERDALCALVAALPIEATLDVACGTGFLTQHLRGSVTGLDQSERMLAIARARRPDATFVTGDGLALPFADGAFDRVLSGHFYGHLGATDRTRFLQEAGRMAPQLVVIDSHIQPGHEAEEWQQRVLSDGSQHEVYKRYFTGRDLAAELGGEVLLDGDWFVAVQRGLAA